MWLWHDYQQKFSFAFDSSCILWAWIFTLQGKTHLQNTKKRWTKQLRGIKIWTTFYVALTQKERKFSLQWENSSRWFRENERKLTKRKEWIPLSSNEFYLLLNVFFGCVFWFIDFWKELKWLKNAKQFHSYK